MRWIKGLNGLTFTESVALVAIGSQAGTDGIVRAIEASDIARAYPLPRVAIQAALDSLRQRRVINRQDDGSWWLPVPTS